MNGFPPSLAPKLVTCPPRQNKGVFQACIALIINTFSFEVHASAGFPHQKRKATTYKKNLNFPFIIHVVYVLVQNRINVEKNSHLSSPHCDASVFSFLFLNTGRVSTFAATTFFYNSKTFSLRLAGVFHTLLKLLLLATPLLKFAKKPQFVTK